ncbi:hypothetical protein [Chelatococcus reniformis]|uniref:hypothetical protein n=1 Tax=Chelatococcus reniformis TaxID=1494448 RepID=UPI001AED9CE7|nr:hypothetical protein [Chelatococcus reniformis]
MVDDQAVATAKLDADQVSQFIKTFAALRAQLLEPVPKRPDALPAPVDDPAIQLERLPTGAIALNIRHPGFGWIAFQLAPGSARRLTEWFRTG